jgi:hypothetical protein
MKVLVALLSLLLIGAAATPVVTGRSGSATIRKAASACPPI